MKTSFAFITLALSVSAVAQERVELNSKKVSVNSSEAVLVRTSQTPETVEITFRVPMANSVCERSSTHSVYLTSGLECGYDLQTRYVYVHGRGGSRRYLETYNYPRTCMVNRSYCVEYGTSTMTESDTMKLKFKDLPALGGSETDTFKIRANQKRVDSEGVLYDISPLQTLVPYKVEKKKVLGLFNTTYVVEKN
ncbi:MAG TPA: hypothetical protein VNJ01_06640 [Bacteriovoracaceae bacterium]|nr:hypothetical protein [Bacteriovoracaceae bacterium]